MKRNAVLLTQILGLLFAFFFIVSPANAMQERESAWTKCADEGERCNFNGTRQVRYGAQNKWMLRDLKNGADCNNQTFGDPIPGVTKHCELGPGTQAEAAWTKCADEGQRCNFNGARIVRYGAQDKYVTRELQNGVDCNNQTFGDPIEGVTKHCELSSGPQVGWLTCAKEGDICNFSGLRSVRYGAKGKFSTPRNFSKSVQCSNAIFGDPIDGVEKFCEYGPEVPIVWTQCATEGGTCNFSGLRLVRYGAKDKFVSDEVFNGTACTSAVFGDPIRGQPKRCEYGPEIEITWTKCANEGQPCEFQGKRQVRYGANGKFAVRELSGGTTCGNQVFGDPLPGSRKRCELGARLR
jgi:hypothetical protein